jgi:uncharacterized membrane protein
VLENSDSSKPVNPFAVLHGNDRMEFFSDGVFAITITLLVLEIKVPDIPAELVAQQLSHDLLHLLPKILGHVMSFIVLGIFWIAHHNVYMYIKRHDHVLLWLNTLFLMCIASLPFPTGLLGHYPDQQIAVVAYAGTLMATGIFLDLIWWYSTTHHLVENVDTKFITFVHKFNRIAPAMYGLSILISFFSLAVAKLIFVLVAVFYIVPNSLYRYHSRELARRYNQ